MDYLFCGLITCRPIRIFSFLFAFSSCILDIPPSSLFPSSPSSTIMFIPFPHYFSPSSSLYSMLRCLSFLPSTSLFSQFTSSLLLFIFLPHFFPSMAFLCSPLSPFLVLFLPRSLSLLLSYNIYDRLFSLSFNISKQPFPSFSFFLFFLLSFSLFLLI